MISALVETALKLYCALGLCSKSSLMLMSLHGLLQSRKNYLTTLKTVGMMTLMCGDGTNDVGALKQVVHPAPGNANGTLVNAILNHCQLPVGACANRKRSTEIEDSDSSDNEIDDFYVDCSDEQFKPSCSEALFCLGIVHRLDKGTSGLLVVAKDEHSHAHLAEQFKLHIIHRLYVSLTTGVPSPSSGRIEIPIARDCINRTRMAAVSGFNSNRNARNAANTRTCEVSENSTAG